MNWQESGRGNMLCDALNTSSGPAHQNQLSVNFQKTIEHETRKDFKQLKGLPDTGVLIDRC